MSNANISYNFIFFLFVVNLPVQVQDMKEDTVKGKERAILMLGAALAKYGFAEGTTESKCSAII